MEIIQAVVLGIIQGLTEWLPVSSTAHLRVVPALVGWPDPGAAFTAVIQLGTIGSVLLYYWKDLQELAVSWGRSLVAGPAADTVQSRTAWAILVGTVPITFCGILFASYIVGPWRSLYVIAFSLILMGVIMAIVDRRSGTKRRAKDVTWKSGLWIGCWQALSLIPGASRSGSTITGARLMGFERQTAARLSFLLSVPSIIGAGLKELWDDRESILGPQLVPAIVATVVSFVVGYYTIGMLLKYLRSHSLQGFAVYRILLGLVILGLLMAGVLSPIDDQKRNKKETDAHGLVSKEAKTIPKPSRMDDRWSGKPRK